MSVIDDVKVIETIGATVLRNIFQEMVKIRLFFHKNRALKVSGHKITAIEKWSSYFCVRPLLNFSNVARFLGEINRF